MTPRGLKNHFPLNSEVHAERGAALLEDSAELQVDAQW